MDIKRFNQTDDINAILSAMDIDGAVIIENAIDQKSLSSLIDQVNNELNEVDNCEGIFYGYETKRYGNLIERHQECQVMAVNPVILSVMDKFLLNSCDSYQLNLTQLISIGPGERAQILHPDAGLFPHVEKGRDAMINVMWAVDDFTKENGATRVAPGSHKWEEGRMPKNHEIAYAEMKKGSCLIYLGRVIHGGGANTTDKPRKGIVISYCLGWLKQADNMFLGISKETAKNLPEKLQRLIGYFVHNPNLGAVDGEDPILYLQDNYKKEKVKFKDFMHKEAQDLLEKHYNDQDSASWSDLDDKAA